MWRRGEVPPGPPVVANRAAGQLVLAQSYARPNWHVGSRLTTARRHARVPPAFSAQRNRRAVLKVGILARRGASREPRQRRHWQRGPWVFVRIIGLLIGETMLPLSPDIWTDKPTNSPTPRDLTPIPPGKQKTSSPKCAGTNVTVALLTETADEADPSLLRSDCVC